MTDITDINPAQIEAIIRHVAATEVAPRFRNLKAGDFREKNPDDFVTVADEASEQLFTKLLSEALPGSLVVGEEAVSRDRSVLDRFADDRPVWVIDPIDGTYNFLHGRSNYGILIALVQGGKTQYGWAYDVPGDRMAFGACGGGAFLDGRPLRISCAKTDLKELVGQGGGAQAWHFASAADEVASIVNLRCALHDFMNFYTGAADFVVHVNKTTPWDHAAVCLIAQEAGGYVAREEEKPYDPSFFGPSFMIAAPSRELWGKLYAALYPKIALRRRA